jgi:hypothetical protein
MEFTIPTLKDPPVRTRVTQVAGPLDQGVVGLDHLEGMGAIAGNCHGRRM